MEGEGKGDGHQYAQDTRANLNSWETHLVRKRWDIGLLPSYGIEPRVYDDDYCEDDRRFTLFESCLHDLRNVNNKVTR